MKIFLIVYFGMALILIITVAVKLFGDLISIDREKARMKKDPNYVSKKKVSFVSGIIYKISKNME